MQGYAAPAAVKRWGGEASPEAPTRSLIHAGMGEASPAAATGRNAIAQPDITGVRGGTFRQRVQPMTFR